MSSGVGVSAEAEPIEPVGGQRRGWVSGVGEAQVFGNLAASESH